MIRMQSRSCRQRIDVTTGFGSEIKVLEIEALEAFF